MESEKELERAVDEFLTRGYRIESRGDQRVRLKDRDVGEIPTHLFLLVFTGWWTFGLANAIYALYRWTNAEEVTVRLDEKTDDK